MTQDAPESPVEDKVASPATLTGHQREQEVLTPYRVIHEVAVAWEYKQEAMEWLQSRFGDRATIAATAGELIQNSGHAHNFNYLRKSNYIWDGYFQPGFGRLIFEIKDHDQDVMLFKLTFGGN